MKILLKSVSAATPVSKNPMLPHLQRHLGKELALDIARLTPSGSFGRKVLENQRSMEKTLASKGLGAWTAEHVYLTFMTVNYDLIRDFKHTHLIPYAKTFVELMSDPSPRNAAALKEAHSKYIRSLDRVFEASREVNKVKSELKDLAYANGAKADVDFFHENYRGFHVTLPSGTIAVYDLTEELLRPAQVLKTTRTLWAAESEDPEAYAHPESLDKTHVADIETVRQYLKSKNAYIYDYVK